MTAPLLFNGLLAFCVLYAFWRGGAPERVAAALMLAAAFATRLTLSQFDGRFGAVETGVFITDLLLLLSLYALALRSNRLWPMVVTALQLSSILIHLAKFADGSMAAWVYQFMLKIWSYPMVLLLIVGVEVHQAFLRRHGVDRAWSQ